MVLAAWPRAPTWQYKLECVNVRAHLHDSACVCTCAHTCLCLARACVCTCARICMTVHACVRARTAAHWPLPGTCKCVCTCARIYMTVDACARARASVWQWMRVLVCVHLYGSGCVCLCAHVFMSSARDGLCLCVIGKRMWTCVSAYCPR